MWGDPVALFVDLVPRYFFFSPPSVSSFCTGPSSDQTDRKPCGVRACERSGMIGRHVEVESNKSGGTPRLINTNNTGAHRGKISQLSILLPPLISLSRMPQEGGGATRWSGRHCTAGPHRETQHIMRSGSQIGTENFFSLCAG